MKILDIIRTHYGDKFLLSFMQDEDVTVFDISYESCSNITFIATNEAADSLVKILSKEGTYGNSTNPNKKLFKLAACEFKGNRWEITAQYTIDFETQYTVFI